MKRQHNFIVISKSGGSTFHQCKHEFSQPEVKSTANIFKQFERFAAEQANKNYFSPKATTTTTKTAERQRNWMNILARIQNYTRHARMSDVCLRSVCLYVGALDFIHITKEKFDTDFVVVFPKSTTLMMRYKRSILFDNKFLEI